IGVVAAMTLPMLAENYQKIIIQTRLKKFYTTFNQAILRSVNDNGPFDGWLYNNPNVYDGDGNLVNQTANNSSVFNLYLRPYLNVIQTQQVMYTNDYDSILYYLADGSAFMYTYADNRDIYYYPKDPVRCLKNTAKSRRGVCEFVFIFVPNYSKVTLPYSYQYWTYHIDKGLEPHKFSWDGKVESLYTTTDYGCNLEHDGVYCAALIQYNNWEFPADYPRKIRY
ncbi:hypothetical protein J6A31_00055, partial [bacterium]|nr:hypothetical protein [bacterium]